MWSGDPQGTSLPLFPSCTVMTGLGFYEYRHPLPTFADANAVAINRRWEIAGRCTPPHTHTQWRQWPGGPLKDGNGDGKRVKIRPGWLDGAVDFRGVIKEPLWLTLSLTSLRQEEDGRGWLPSPSWNEGTDNGDFLNYLLFISFYQQESRKIIPLYITTLLFLTILGLIL